MRRPKTAYELRESQVKTPQNAIALFWALLNQKRPKLDRVLDLGAGDGRFAVGGAYRRYDGLEIDPRTSPAAGLPKNARILTTCAFKHVPTGYDACIGNPPYVRHHDIEPPWKEKTISRINEDLGIKLDRHGNLYLYFLSLGLIKSSETGVVALIIPFEWVSRPSASAVRSYIHSRKWNVSVYRFSHSIFDEVLTTASISIIDKRTKSDEWTFYDVLPNLSVKSRNGVSGNSLKILSHAPRGKVWARRGMSPGTQKIFTLTEGERIHAGLQMSDVVPCVTTLRCLPRELRELNQAAFTKHLVDAGCRCWLIKSDEERISARLKGYLSNVPAAERQTYTCLNQDPWYAFETVPVPDLLFHSGFTAFGPKVLINSVGAKSVGSVYGIHCDERVPLRKLQSYLINFDFERRVVAHAKSLKKIEVRQLNSVLSRWLKANE
ncbi:MAG TPA: Eco57I restriction-modification methylase domain-containing protein [Terriglobia bacterium]|nr:Eco57I restriction-modification methylase domain-containing protein [Terriglobia bacterium]